MLASIEDLLNDARKSAMHAEITYVMCSTSENKKIKIETRTNYDRLLVQKNSQELISSSNL